MLNDHSVMRQALPTIFYILRAVNKSYGPILANFCSFIEVVRFTRLINWEVLVCASVLETIEFRCE